MRTHYVTPAVLLLVLLVLSGCFAGKGKQTKGQDAPAEKTESDLYSQVPAALKAPVQKAGFELEEARNALEKAKEQVLLAEMEKEYATLAKKRADLKEELAEAAVEKAEYTYALKKAQAIDKANLGDKADNIDEIAKLQTKELGMQSEMVEINADISQLDLEMKQLNIDIEKQTAKVAGMK